MSSEIFIRIEDGVAMVISERHPFEIHEVYEPDLQQYEKAFAKFAKVRGSPIYGSLSLLGASKRAQGSQRSDHD